MRQVPASAITSAQDPCRAMWNTSTHQEAVMTDDRLLLDRITVDPDVMVGKPVIRGTRVPVELVLGFLAAKPDLGELFAAYPPPDR